MFSVTAIFAGIIGFIIDIIIAVVASKKGRSGIGWFFISLLTTPLIAGIILLVLGDKKPVTAGSPGPQSTTTSPPNTLPNQTRTETLSSKPVMQEKVREVLYTKEMHSFVLEEPLYVTSISLSKSGDSVILSASVKSWVKTNYKYSEWKVIVYDIAGRRIPDTPNLILKKETAYGCNKKVMMELSSNELKEARSAELQLLLVVDEQNVTTSFLVGSRTEKEIPKSEKVDVAVQEDAVTEFHNYFKQKTDCSLPESDMM